MSIIAVESVSRSFGSTLAVDKLSFEVRGGEIFALLGPNGAGKTTTIKMIMGMLKPDEGRICIHGDEISSKDNGYKSRIGYMPENSALYENLTGLEYLSFVGELYHLPFGTIREKSNRLLGMLELDGAGKQLIREYSKGMKQKILMISALMHNPDLIILDEPFTGLDANASGVFKEILREQARQGKAIIFCSHVLEVVERLVDRLLIIKNGRNVASGTLEQVMNANGRSTLDKVFAELTGARDADTVAREIVDVIDDRREGRANG